MDINAAFRQGNDDAIIAHLQQSYNVNNDPEKLLMTAAHYGNEKILRACLDLGIHPDIHCALCWACGKGKLRPIKLLVSAGADVNIKCALGGTPITTSAGSGKLNELKYLLKQGAHIDGALSAAVAGEYKKVVEFLIAEGANLEEYGDGEGLTPLTKACHSWHKKGHEIALLLIYAGANVNYVRNSDETTPLKWAAASSIPDVVQALIDHGAEVDGPAGTEQTPLMYAARANNVATIDVLLRNGANPDLPCGLPWAEGRTAEGLAELENRRDAYIYLRAARECPRS